MKNFLFWLLFAVCVLSGGQAAHSQPQINITQGSFNPVPFAMPVLFGADTPSKEMGEKITKVVVSNLERCGLFRYIDPRSYVQDATSAMSAPQFEQWRLLNAQTLVVGECQIQGDRVEVRFYVWDIFNKQGALEALRLSIAVKEWRRLAHKIADSVYKRLTGEEGYFDSRMIYISESGPLQKRVRRLAIMDQDGENHKFLSDGQNMVFTPRFSPANPKVIAYLAFVNRQPRVYVANLDTGQQRMVGGGFPGMTFSPRFSQDGQTLLMSYAHQGKTILVEYDLKTDKFQRRTLPVSIDVSPSYSPDGRQIVFASDRGGRPQLYVMNIDGSGQTRISFGEGSCTAPSWSPRGDWIAYVRKNKGVFSLRVMRPDGSKDREVANGFFIDMPSWSPNGRVLLFMRQTPNAQGGIAKIHTVDITGRFERTIVTPNNGSDPSWSPVNQQ